MKPETSPENSNVETLVSENEIHERLEELAGEIKELDLHPLLVVAILKGSFVFAADLIRAMQRAGLSLEVDFMTLSSYRNSTVSTGTVEILRDVELEVKGRNVLLIDDVLDSGRTLAFAKDLLAARGAASLRTCVLIDKKSQRAVNLEPDFRAFECPDEFVIGYGMDLAHRFRELPFVGKFTSHE